MAHNPISNSPAEKEQEGLMARRKSYGDIVAALPLDENWPSVRHRKYDGFWYREATIPVKIAIQHTFKARPSDILLVTQPKSGTTWLKALAFSIANRNKYPLEGQEHHPLLTSNPHSCVPFLDYFYDKETLLPDDSLNALPSPRLISLHLPYSGLPSSVTESGCKVIYLCRDPKDSLLSLWHFLNDVRPESVIEPMPFSKAFELFCEGVSLFGPIWEHQLEYWQASKSLPHKIMFLKYEEMKADTAGHVKTMAEFMGFPFSKDEAEGGAVEEIVRMCSFENLSRINIGMPDVKPRKNLLVKSSAFFRKGAVGDWRNYMSPEMARRLDEITEDKFRGSGLSFPSGNGGLDNVQEESDEGQHASLSAGYADAPGPGGPMEDIVSMTSDSAGE